MKYGRRVKAKHYKKPKIIVHGKEVGDFDVKKLEKRSKKPFFTEV